MWPPGDITFCGLQEALSGGSPVTFLIKPRELGQGVLSVGGLEGACQHGGRKPGHICDHLKRCHRGQS